MARVDTNSYCADLLDRCAAHYPLLLARVALAAGLSPSEIDACRSRATRLTPEAQIRIADAIERRATTLVRAARRLRAQAEASLRFAASEPSVVSATGAPSTLRHAPGGARARAGPQRE